MKEMLGWALVLVVLITPGAIARLIWHSDLAGLVVMGAFILICSAIYKWRRILRGR